MSWCDCCLSEDDYQNETLASAHETIIPFLLTVLPLHSTFKALPDEELLLRFDHRVHASSVLDGTAGRTKTKPSGIFPITSGVRAIESRREFLYFN